MEFVANGWNPFDAHSVLERMKQTIMEDTARHLDMLIDGIGGLLNDEHTTVLSERLRAYLPLKHRHG